MKELYKFKISQLKLTEKHLNRNPLTLLCSYGLMVLRSYGLTVLRSYGLTLFLLLLCTVQTFAQATVTNVNYSCPGQITVTYNLAANTTDAVLWYSPDKCTWLQAVTVTGDAGAVSAGNGKVIVWDNVADQVQFGKFYFKVKVPCTSFPAQPGTITASTTCITSLTHHTFAVFSVATNPGLTYNWSVPDGWTITTRKFGATRDTITVTPPAYDPAGVLGYTGTVTISVTATDNNGCTGPARNSSAITYQNIPLPVFAPTNLGADPIISDPKSQMQYTHGTLDGRVYGGRFQWGRDNAGNYAIDPATFALFQGNGPAYRSTVLTVNATYDANGQILTNDGTNSATTLHVYDNAIVTGTRYDWSITQNDNLWGNGVGISTATQNLGLSDPGILHSNGNCYQSTSWQIPANNPCPAGWRVPIQDEWERLGGYGCNAQNVAAGTVSISTTTQIWGAPTVNGFVWVRVKNGIPFLGSWAYFDRSGYAVYRTDDWNVAIATGGYFAGLLQNGSNVATIFSGKTLYDAGAPMPFLFLPAAGYRYINSGDLANVGAVGYYWSSTPFSSNAGILFFGSNSVNPSDSYNRAVGISVRCVAE